tara:strand:- start:15523 stop:15897 length:375 start_codon:yes stop_codon:yes gene_type:complete
MKNILYKFNKNTLTTVDSETLLTEGAVSLTVNHNAGKTISASNDISFTAQGTGSVSGKNSTVPYINDNSYMTVIRERVDLSARGPDDVRMKNLGKDVGKENYKDSLPAQPRNPFYGFTILKDIE